MINYEGIVFGLVSGGVEFGDEGHNHNCLSVQILLYVIFRSDVVIVFL